MKTAAERSLEDVLTSIAGSLKRGGAVDQSLPNGLGYIFVDHLQPFLCVYRERPDGQDHGTRRLLSGQASYLIGDVTSERELRLREVVSSLVELMLDAYGVALVIEVWSAQEPVEDSVFNLPPRRYRIVTEEQGVSRATVESIERALMALDVPYKTEIVLEYQDRVAPVGRASIVSEEDEARNDVFVVGLEVPPTYRDEQSGKLIPEALRQETLQLGNVLRQACYAFAHRHATFKPAHFHELGPRAMADEIAVVDASLAEVGDSFDLLLHATPVNAEAAFSRFAETGYRTVPEFLYRPLTVNHGDLKLALYKAPLETIEDPALYFLYAAQRDELDRQITMLTDRNTRRFLLESQQVFGGPDDRLREIAKLLLASPTDDSATSEEVAILNARDFAALAEEEIQHYRDTWPSLPARVEIRDDIPGVMVSNGHFFIGSSVAVRADRVVPLLHHEVGTHILTYYNGMSQPLSQFHSGMPGYEETQEGLAVLTEYLCGKLTATRLRTLAARVVAVDSTIGGADFVETFRLLREDYGFPSRDAFTIAMRVHRGGGLTKDIVYLRGLVALLDHLAEGNSFDDLLLGKVCLDYMDIVEELRWRRIVSPGPLKPRYLDDPDALRRLNSLPTGAELRSLLKGNLT